MHTYIRSTTYIHRLQLLLVVARGEGHHRGRETNIPILETMPTTMAMPTPTTTTTTTTTTTATTATTTTTATTITTTATPSPTTTTNDKRQRQRARDKTRRTKHNAALIYVRASNLRGCVCVFFLYSWVFVPGTFAPSFAYERVEQPCRSW